MSIEWKFGNQTVTTIARDDKRHPRKSVDLTGGTVRAHANVCNVNDRDGIVILFDELVNGVEGIHFSRFRGFVKSRRRRNQLAEALASLGFGNGNKVWIARELVKASGDTVIPFKKPKHGPDEM